MSRKITFAVLTFLAVMLFSGCSEKAAQEDFFAMDTVMQFQLYGDNAEDALKKAKQEILEIDGRLSIANEESEVFRVNKEGGGIVSSDTSDLVERALEISEKTDGAFDISIYPVVNLWGFYGDEQKVPDDEAIKKALANTGKGCISVSGNEIIFRDGNVKMDLGGIAKGWAAGKAAQILKENGVTSAALSLGGNVRVLGLKPDGSKWKVGIVDPLNTEGQAAVVQAEDCSVVTSGGYQRFFEKDGKTYHHIIDPKTGKPADAGLLSATVVSKDDTLADALSTAVFVMGEEKALEFWKNSDEEFELLLITEDLRVVITNGLKGLAEAGGTYTLEVAG